MTGPLASEFLPISGLMVEMRSRILAANLCERIAVHSRDAKRGDHHAFVTPPSFRKKLGYATWFVLVLILEYLIIRKQTEQWAEYREVGVVSSFKLRTQWLKMLLYLIIDVATLTGAARVALGERYAGVMGDDTLIERVRSVCKQIG